MADIRYEGIAEYFKLSNKKHLGPYSDSKKIPIAFIGIRSEQEGLKEFELPINIPEDPFSVRLIESEVIGQRVTYEEKYDSFVRWNLQVHSGKFKDVSYTLEELIDVSL